MTNTKETPTYKMVGKDLVLLADTIIDENLFVYGNIICEYGSSSSLTVYGHINARNIDVHDILTRSICARNIDANNIEAADIDAKIIDAKIIDANNIDANYIDAINIIADNVEAQIIFCEKRTKKTPEAKTFAMSLVENRTKLKRKEQIPKIESPTFRFEGDDLVLYKDVQIMSDVNIKGNIICRNGKHSLTVHGDIRAFNINAFDINAENINAFDINAENIVVRNIEARNIEAYGIDAGNINADDINANDIICEKRTKKTPDAKTFAITLTLNRCKLVRMEQIPMETKT